METIKIDKTFESLEECEKWESENFPDRSYQGKTILCVHHTEKAWNGHVTIDFVTVI